MKILIVNDPHLSDQAPVSRTESYTEDILNKLVEIGELAETYKVEFVMITGDLFHQKQAWKVSHRLVQLVIDIFERYPCRVELTVGNHDIAAGRLDSLQKQPLGVVLKSSNVQTSLSCSFDVIHGTGEFIRGDIESQVAQREVKHKILVAHMPIAPPSQTYPYPFVGAESSVFARWKGVIYGHQHAEDGFYTCGRTWFLNFGAICRGALLASNLERKPKVVLADIDVATGEIDVTPILLATARPAEEVFRLKEAQQSKLNKEDAQKFLSSLSSTSFAFTSIDQVVKHIQVAVDVEEDVKRAAIGILENM